MSIDSSVPKSIVLLFCFLCNYVVVKCEYECEYIRVPWWGMNTAVYTQLYQYLVWLRVSTSTLMKYDHQYTSISILGEYVYECTYEYEYKRVTWWNMSTSKRVSVFWVSMCTSIHTSMSINEKLDETWALVNEYQ